MNSVTPIDCLIDDLIEKNAAFACWFQSSSDSPQLIAGSAEAGQFIHDFEPHDRRYYTGFLGPWRLEKGGTEVYVNLRSMEIEDNQYVLYTGGGITARSNPEQEWEETTQKSRTLLNAIEALQEQV